MIDERDAVIEAVRGRLRASVADQADPRAVARILSAAFAAPAPSRWRRWLDAWHLPVMSRVGAAVVAVIALAAGFVARGVLPNRAPVDPMAVTGEFPIPVTPASDPRSGAVATQFVFEAPAAQSVALVGDFNGWVPTAAPLVRLRSGVWTVTVPLMPGRHVYAFLVDGARSMPTTADRAPW
ncbi:MAG: isoamylase early set domain-containing protein [Gemmatimonadetes bacterium]|nr:isoamylase early set domain-containing protein [Gemmatimonadota bacterium]